MCVCVCVYACDKFATYCICLNSKRISLCKLIKLTESQAYIYIYIYIYIIYIYIYQWCGACAECACMHIKHERKSHCIGMIAHYKVQTQPSIIYDIGVQLPACDYNAQ